MYSYVINLCYDGRCFSGYQVQPGARTVGAEVLRALTGLFGSVTALSGCSRTDSGVHALSYYASFKAGKHFQPEVVVRALNATLPRDIAVKNCRFTDGGFHARYSVKRKEYIYRIWTNPVRSPFHEGYTWFFGHDIDTGLLNRAAEKLLGTHDFRAFMSSGSDIKDTVRTVYSARFERCGDEVVFRICADGFLYNMIRIIVGTMILVQRGRLLPEDIPAVIESRDRNQAGPTAPPDGLYLAEVYYD